MRILCLALALLVGSAPASPTPPPADECRRLVALAPSAVELLFALGLGDRVVGVGDYVRWPDEASDLPRLGGLVDPHREQIVSLRPDLAVLLPAEAELGRQLRGLGIETLEVPSETVDDVLEAALRIGERCPDADEEWREGFRKALAPRAVGGGRTVLLVVDRRAGDLSNVLAAGPGTFYDEILTRLGARNLLHDAAVRYPQLSLEQVLARDPDVIVELQAEEPAPEASNRLLSDWSRLGDLRAVREGEVHVISGDHVLVPGPRLPLLYERFAEILSGSP